MAYTLSVLAMRTVMVLFFLGLAGCAIAVVFSWVSIFGTIFKRGE
jgi:hypothetical protein